MNIDLGNINQTRAKNYLGFYNGLLKAPHCLNSFSFYIVNSHQFSQWCKKYIYSIFAQQTFIKNCLCEGYAWPYAQDHYSLGEQEKNFDNVLHPVNWNITFIFPMWIWSPQEKITVLISDYPSKLFRLYFF